MKDIYTWTDIPHDPIVIDLMGDQNGDFHEAIRVGLGFPKYYGRNWDAFWDLLWEFGMSCPEGKTIIYKGMSSVGERAKERITTISGWANEKYPHIRFRFED